MTLHLGNIPANSTLYVPFASYDANGASVTLTGLAVTDIEIYKNGSVTQRSSDAGYALLDTDGIDFDAITGIHGFSIDLSDNTDAGFFAVGSFYWVVVSAVTISTQTVNFIAATFRIVAAEAIAGKPKADVDAWLGTAASTPTVAGVPNVNAKTWNDLTTVALPLIPTVAGRTLDVSAGGEAGLDWANVGTQSTAVNLSATTVNLVNTLTTYTGNTVQTGDAFARLGAAGAGLTAIPWNAAWDTEVQSEVEDGLVVHRLDELLNADSDIDGVAPPAVGSVFHELLSKTAGSFTFDQTTDSLEAIRDKETDIETDTAEIGTAGAGLTNINLPNQTMDIIGNITGNLSGSVGSVMGSVGSVAGLTASNLDATISSRATPAQVNTEVVDALNVDTYAEPGQGTPPATTSIQLKLSYVYKAWRNRNTMGISAGYKLYGDDAVTVDQKATFSDDATTADRGEMAAGP